MVNTFDRNTLDKRVVQTSFVRRREEEIRSRWVMCLEDGCGFGYKVWHDGTPRLKVKEVPAEYRRYADLFHFDVYGFPIWELIIAEHEDKSERHMMKEIKHLITEVPHAPRNPIGRNEVCTQCHVKAKRHESADHDFTLIPRALDIPYYVLNKYATAA